MEPPIGVSFVFFFLSTPHRGPRVSLDELPILEKALYRFCVWVFAPVLPAFLVLRVSRERGGRG